MSFRKFLFWLHLVAGVVSGIAIGVMCFTGTALAFEKQLVAWSERDVRQVAESSSAQPRLTIDELTARVRTTFPDAKPASIAVSSNQRQAVMFSLGRDENVFANPYTGEVRKPSSTRVHDAMHSLTDWHRFLALSGDQRPTGKLINGICNIAFFVLAVTGLYLWMPRQWSWKSVRAVSLLNGRLKGKGRDFNWHNVIGLWSAPVLIVLTLTAIPISFRWGSNLVYRIVGEEPPVQAGPPGSGLAAIELPKVEPGTQPISREAQFTAVQKLFPDWEVITLRLSAPGRGSPSPTGQANPPRTDTSPAMVAEPGMNAERSAGREQRPRSSGPQPLNFVVKSNAAWPKTATTTVTLNPFTGDVLKQEAFADLSRGRQLRTWTRFLHTGEAVGPIGQLVAGLACLGGCFLVYTGFALAYRRFFTKAPAENTAQ